MAAGWVAFRGVIIGGAGKSLAAGRLLQSLLVGVNAADPAMLAAAAALLSRGSASRLPRPRSTSHPSGPS